MAAPQIPLYTGEIPNRNTQSASEFSDAADTTMNYLLTVPEEYNSLSDFINATATAYNGVVNYKGYWSDLSGGYSLGISVQHNDSVWLLNVDTTDITATEPSDANTDWTKLASFTQQLQNTTNINNAQFSKYRSDRVYCCGDVCFTEDGNGKKTFWEWYSNVESLADKDPELDANRRTGWSDTTKPFYWLPYSPKMAGETMYWDADAIPENMVVGIGQQLPVAVYHTLAAAKPEWIDGVDNTLLNIPDRCGRFVRAADGVTWPAGGTHEDQLQNIVGYFGGHGSETAGWMRTASGAIFGSIVHGNQYYAFPTTYTGASSYGIANFDASRVARTGEETQPKAYIEWVGYAL